LYAQYFPSSKTIAMNSLWMERAIEEFKRRQDVLADFAHPDMYECNIHLIAGIDKVLHELMHSFTNHILQFEAQQKLQSTTLPEGGGGLTIEPFDITPAEIGTRFNKSDGKSVIGDMGCEFQELLFGNSLRLKFHYVSAWTPVAIYFEKCVLEVVKNRAFRHNHNFTDTVDEKKFLIAIRQSFQTYLTNQTATNAVALYNSFKVDTNHFD